MKEVVKNEFDMEEMSDPKMVDINSADYKLTLPDYANFERINAFEDMSERGSATITCIYGAYGSGKSRLVNKMYCENAQHQPVILDGDSMRYYVNNDLFSDDAANIESATRMAKLALYFAMQGRDVILDGVRADAAYAYLQHTLTDVQSRRTRVKKRYQQGVDISLELIHTEGSCVFPK